MKNQSSEERGCRIREVGTTAHEQERFLVKQAYWTLYDIADVHIVDAKSLRSQVIRAS